MNNTHNRIAEMLEDRAALAQPDVPETAFGNMEPAAWADKYDAEREGNDMKAYEEIKFPSGYIRWIREGDEYVCRMSETYMAEMKIQHEQPEPEPVAWADKYDVEREGHDFWVSRQKPARDGVPLYTSPKREWVGLTDEEIDKYSPTDIVKNRVAFARVIEAKLKENNT